MEANQAMPRRFTAKERPVPDSCLRESAEPWASRKGRDSQHFLDFTFAEGKKPLYSLRNGSFGMIKLAHPHLSIVVIFREKVME